MQVQRGKATIIATNHSVTVDLATPVPVGKSWVMASCIASTTVSDWSRFRATAVLNTVVNDEYTKVTFWKTTTSDSLVVAYEVIWGDEFTVQQGETTLNANPMDITISAVNRAKTFVVGQFTPSSSGNSEYQTGTLALTSDTNLEWRMTGNYGGKLSWYVVTWEGASVQAVEFACTGSSEDVAITAVDLDKTFYVGTFRGSSSSSTSWGYHCAQVKFTATDNIQMVRHTTLGTITGRGFVVAHPDILVQSESDLDTRATSVDRTIDPVDLDKAFVAVSVLPNRSYDSTGSGQYATRVLMQETLEDAETWRGATHGAATWDRLTTYFVVEYVPPLFSDPRPVDLVGIRTPTLSATYEGADEPVDIVFEWDTVNTFDGADFDTDTVLGVDTGDRPAVLIDLGTNDGPWYWRVGVDGTEVEWGPTWSFKYTDPAYFVQEPQWQHQLGPRPNRVLVRIGETSTIKSAAAAGVPDAGKIDYWLGVPADTTESEAQATANAALAALQARPVLISGPIALTVTMPFGKRVVVGWWDRDRSTLAPTERESHTLAIAKKVHNIDEGTTELFLGDYAPPPEAIIAQLIARVSRT